MNFGQWEGRCYDEIFLSNKEEWEKWLKNPVAYPLPSQEEFHIFEERIRDFLNEINKTKRRKSFDCCSWRLYPGHDMYRNRNRSGKYMGIKTYKHRDITASKRYSHIMLF